MCNEPRRRRKFTRGGFERVFIHRWKNRSENFLTFLRNFGNVHSMGNFLLVCCTKFFQMQSMRLDYRDVFEENLKMFWNICGSFSRTFWYLVNIITSCDDFRNLIMHILFVSHKTFWTHKINQDDRMCLLLINLKLLIKLQRKNENKNVNTNNDNDKLIFK